MNRRAFVFAVPALFSARLIAAPSAPARFLLVFLRGGYDAANVVVPISSSDYYSGRPNIAIPRDACRRLDADWGLHPALAESIHPLYEKREAAFIAFAGTDDTSRSHFETQDTIELGQPLASRTYASGFFNPRPAEGGGRGAIAFGNQLPVAFRGPAPVANVALMAPKPAVDARQSELIAEMYRGSSLEAPVAEGFAAREAVMRDLGEEMKAANRNAVTPRAFEAQVKRVARLMRSDYRLAFIDVGGWDTHVGEGGVQGQLATRLEALGAALSSFAGAMGDEWRNTVVMVISEFGRTFRENGNRGTDHGHGTVYWALGGALAGGRVVGEQVRVARGTLFQDRDYPVLNDYRAVLGGLLARTYGLQGEALARVFPGATPKDLALV
jgi:uncharacterized protein (DUF1501 family)